MTRRETLTDDRCSFGLDPDDADLWPLLLQRHGHPADQPAPADGNHHRANVRERLQDFEPDRTLSRGDGRVVEWVNEVQVPPALLSFQARLPVGHRTEDEFGPEIPNRLELGHL